MPQLLYPHGKSPWYSLDKRLDGPHSQSGMMAKIKNPIIPLLGIEP